MTADALIEAVARELHHAGWERDYWTDCAHKVIAAIEANGYRVVPVEPTQQMLADADSAIPRFEPDVYTGYRMMGVDAAELAWRAMILAAPKLTEPKE